LDSRKYISFSPAGPVPRDGNRFSFLWEVVQADRVVNGKTPLSFRAKIVEMEMEEEVCPVKPFD
jgi:hypothetical protein